MAPGPVILTRPAGAGADEAAALAGLARPVWWWPAFVLLPAADPATVALGMTAVASADLALFVSPPAVRFSLPYWPRPWPLACALGAVGAGTLAALRAALPDDALAADAPVPGPQPRCVAPAATATPGSEGFWDAWQASGLAARRVVIVRALQGREWLRERFEQSGAQVDIVVAYRREPHALAADQCTALARAVREAAPPALVVTSTEAVAALLQQLGRVDGALAWARRGVALATHPRIADRLRAAGFADVREAADGGLAWIATLQSPQA